MGDKIETSQTDDDGPTMDKLRPRPPRPVIEPRPQREPKPKNEIATPDPAAEAREARRVEALRELCASGGELPESRSVGPGPHDLFADELEPLAQNRWYNLASVGLGEQGFVAACIPSRQTVGRRRKSEKGGGGRTSYGYGNRAKGVWNGSNLESVIRVIWAQARRAELLDESYGFHAK